MIDSISDEGGGGRRRRRGSDALPGVDRLPPHSVEAEQGVLGCILWTPACLDDVRPVLNAEDVFYDLRHKTIFDVLVKSSEARKPIDLITVQQALKDDNMLEQVGGITYLSSLQDAVPSSANVSYYVEIVKEKWTARRLIRTCSDAVARIYEGTEENSVPLVLAATEQEILAIGSTSVKSAAVHVKELVKLAIDRVEERFQRGRQFKEGPQTGLRFVDNIVPGFAPGQLIVLAGRPGDGKSCLAMQIAEHAALIEAVGVGVWSLEMTGVSMVERQLFSMGGANLTKMRNGFLIQADVPKLINAAGKLCKGNLWIESASRMCIEDLEVKARRMVRKHGVKLLIVDYLQLLFLRARGRMERVEEMGQVSMRLKALAMELQVPIIACTQMNRNIETAEKSRRPLLSDIRESGQIEQDADVVGILWKPKVKDPEDANGPDMRWMKRLEGVPKEWLSCDFEGSEIKWMRHFRRVNLFIAKQREGRSDVDANLVFVRDWCRFLDPWQPGPGDELPAEDTEPEASQQRCPTGEQEEPTQEELSEASRQRCPTGEELV